MSPEEIQFDNYLYLVKNTVHKLFKNPRKLAQDNHLEYQDLIQFGNIGLWKGISTFDHNKHKCKLTTFLISSIRWTIFRYIQKDGLNPKIYKDKYYKKDENPRLTLISMSHNPFGDEDDKTFYDIIACDNINNFTADGVESKVLSSMDYHNMLTVLNKLKEKDRELVLLKMDENLNNEQIAERYGISRQAVHVKLKRIQKRINQLRGELI